jgi:hypothetical protein
MALIGSALSKESRVDTVTTTPREQAAYKAITADRREYKVSPPPAREARADPAHEPPRRSARQTRGSQSKSRARSKLREAGQTGVGVAGGQVARRGLTDVTDLRAVVDVARRVGSRQTQGMTDEQVLRWLAEKPGRMRTLGGHVFERLDAGDMEKLTKLTGGRTPLLRLYPAHNRPGLDGAYIGARKAGKACYAQHKLSENPEMLKKAASKANVRVRGKTELVVGRGTKVNGKTAEGLKGVREAGRSVKGVNAMVQKAADPQKVKAVGAKAAEKLTAKAAVGGALIGAGISVASDIRGVVCGERTKEEAAENAAWAAGEAALCTLGTAGATAASASTIAAGTAALAGSSVAGTTALAAGLATLGPVGLGIGASLGVGYGVKRLRAKTRG